MAVFAAAGTAQIERISTNRGISVASQVGEKSPVAVGGVANTHSVGLKRVRTVSRVVDACVVVMKGKATGGRISVTDGITKKCMVTKCRILVACGIIL